MIVSYKTLSRYIDLTDITPEEIQDKLTFAGLEVEEVKPLAQGTKLVMGFVKSVNKHPESDKLNVCLVDVGESEDVQIVCGAANVRKDTYVIVALVGSKLKYAKVPEIKKVELAGVLSCGMICSLQEIGIAEKFQSQEELDGIYIAQGSYKPGEEALSALGFDDYIFDISLTPNRSDIYSIYALALELSALINREVKDTKMSVTQTNNSKYKVVINDDACQSYCLFDFNNVISKQSNHQLKIELMALGIKPRFNIVDVANLAMVISGNPVHTFDADKLKSDTFTITKGVKKTDFLALDDNIYEIVEDDLVIMNGDEIVCIAGVIGSKSSCIDENTKNVVIESAFFDHVSIRNTARRLDLFSEASIRFSKIVNKYTLDFPIAIFENELSLECNGLTRENVIPYQAKQINLDYAKIEKILGLTIDFDTCIDILKSLSFDVKVNNNTIECFPPSYRKDIELDVDVIEELIRVYGYDKIPATLPLQAIEYQSYTPLQEIIRNTRNILVNNGLNEIITYQLNSKNSLDTFSDVKEYKTLANPLSSDRECFRNQLYTNMVETLQHNMSYQHSNLALFELSNVYLDNKEQQILSIGMSGIFESNIWQQKNNNVDFYLLKGIIFNLLDKLGYHYGRYLIEPVESNHEYLHPTRAAYLTINKKRIGAFGQLHPNILNKFKLKESYVANINLDMLVVNKARNNKYEKVNLLPSVSRDLSLIIPNEINASDIVRLAKTGNNKLVKDVIIFDLYHGDNLPDNHYSMSISLKIKDDKSTLSEVEINNVINNILDSFKKKYNVLLRQ